MANSTPPNPPWLNSREQRRLLSLLHTTLQHLHERQTDSATQPARDFSPSFALHDKVTRLVDDPLACWVNKNLKRALKRDGLPPTTQHAFLRKPLQDKNLVLVTPAFVYNDQKNFITWDIATPTRITRTAQPAQRTPAADSFIAAISPHHWLLLVLVRTVYNTLGTWSFHVAVGTIGPPGLEESLTHQLQALAFVLSTPDLDLEWFIRLVEAMAAGGNWFDLTTAYRTI